MAIIDIPELINRSEDEIKDSIKEFKSKIFGQNLPYDIVKAGIEKIAFGYRKKNYCWWSFNEGFYRARKHTDVWKNKNFNTTKELWYRDWSKVNQTEHEFGRVNLPGENIFYLSTAQSASIVETQPKAGDWVTVAHIKPTDYFQINLITIAENYLSKACPFVDSILNKKIGDGNALSNDSKRKIEIIDSFLIEIFTNSREDNHLEIYKSTTAIAKYLMEINPYYNFNGIMYPSIALGLDAVNIGIYPKAIDNLFFVDSLIVFQIDEKCEFENSIRIDKHPINVGISDFKRCADTKINYQLPTNEQMMAYSKPIVFKKSNLEFETWN